LDSKFTPAADVPRTEVPIQRATWTANLH